MKQFDGYKKRTLTDTLVLLAGGGNKPISDFIGSLQWDDLNRKLQYKSASATTWTDLVAFGSNAMSSTSYLPLTGGTITNGSNWAAINFSRTGVGSGTVGGIDTNGLYFMHQDSAGTSSISMYLKAGEGLKVDGTKVSLEGHTHDYLPTTNPTVNLYLRFNAFPGGNYGSGTCEIYYNLKDDCLRTNYVGNINLNGNKVWHEGNDGAESGLDADTVDGYHYNNLPYLPKSSSVSNYNTWNDSDYGFSIWAPSSTGIPESYGTSLNFRDPSTTWYYRLMFGTGGRIYYRNGINTTSFSNIGTIAYLSDIPTKASWDYDDRYVTSVGNGSGSYINNLYYTKNGSNNYFTVNYATNADTATHIKQTYINSSSNLNNIANGFYYHSDLNNPTNFVSYNCAFLLFSGRGGYDKFQLEFGANEERIWFRKASNNTFSSWKMIAWTSDIPSTYDWSAITNKPDTFTPSSHNHNGSYSYSHQSSFAFNVAHDSNYVTFDQNAPAGAPDSNWYTGFVSTHSNYLSSYIINAHRTANWYVGYSENTTAPTWYALIHSGNISSQSVAYATSAGSSEYSTYLKPQSYTPTNNTVAGHKAGLVNWMNTDGNAGIGRHVIVSASIIGQWNNDSANYYDSSVYAMIKIGGGYTYSTYGQWLLSGYSTNRLGVIGRNGNAWDSGGIRWIAYTSDIPSTISWANVTDKTDFTTRWPSWSEVTEKPSIWNILTISKSLTPTTSWVDTGIQSNSLTDGAGTYIIELSYPATGSSGWLPAYCGIFYNYLGTNGGAAEEIILYRQAHSGEGIRVFLRWIQTSNSYGYTKLQIRSESNFPTTYTYTFKFRRMI